MRFFLKPKKMNTDQKNTESNRSVQALVEERLAFLKGYSSTLVPDPEEAISIEKRVELKQEQSEMQIRINELEKLLKKMREN